MIEAAVESGRWSNRAGAVDIWQGGKAGLTGACLPDPRRTGNERKLSMVDGSRLRLSAGFACLAIAVIVSMGCTAAHERQVGFVSGRVTCDGRPLTSGVVIFTPVEVEGGPNVSEQDFAKGARGLVNPDGTYQLSTYSEDDGAVVGVHEVRVMQLDPDDDDAPVENGGFACSQEVVRVTVEKGSNTIDLSLSR